LIFRAAPVNFNGPVDRKLKKAGMPETVEYSHPEPDSQNILCQKGGVGVNILEKTSKRDE